MLGSGRLHTSKKRVDHEGGPEWKPRKSHPWNVIKLVPPFGGINRKLVSKWLDGL